MTLRTPSGIAFERSGPPGDRPVVLLHAGIADRRMWDPQWEALADSCDVVRLDLRGYGDSTEPPAGPMSPVGDVVDTLVHLGVHRCHLVGASYGAGVAVEVAVTRPDLVETMLLSAPGGALIASVTPQLREFFDAERAALAAGDLDGAVEANLSWWVDGPRRAPGSVDATMREHVRLMQRRAFELTASWDDLAESELDPPALERLHEVAAPTLVLVGALDLDAVLDTATLVADAVPGASRVDWPDVAHLPSMERPDDFLDLLRTWLTSASG